MSNKAVHAVVTGRVQGVSFRYYTRHKARELGVSGWVRNRSDGTVEAMVSGDAPQVERMLEWLEQGSPSASVEEVRTTPVDDPPPAGPFEIIY